MPEMKRQVVYEAQISLDETVGVIEDTMASAVSMIERRYGQEPLAIKVSWREIIAGEED